MFIFATKRKQNVINESPLNLSTKHSILRFVCERKPFQVSRTPLNRRQESLRRLSRTFSFSANLPTRLPTHECRQKGQKGPKKTSFLSAPSTERMGQPGSNSPLFPHEKRIKVQNTAHFKFKRDITFCRKALMVTQVLQWVYDPGPRTNKGGIRENPRM